MTPDELDRVELETGDITDLAALESVIDRHDITNVIHLAALQVPFCRADPPLGRAGQRRRHGERVRGGEATGAARMAPVVYTSSIAAFADDDADPATGRLTVEATGHPRTHYGVYKLANEGNARVYWLDDGVPSVGLRPMTVYGVGRDQGMTSGPTKAVVAAVLGLPYTVAFGGPTLFQYAEDVARTLVAASRSRLPGAHVFNLPRRGRRRTGARRRHRGRRPRVDRPNHVRAGRRCPSRPRSTTTASRRSARCRSRRSPRASRRAWRSTGSLAAAGRLDPAEPRPRARRPPRPRRARAPGRRSGRRRPRSPRTAGRAPGRPPMASPRRRGGSSPRVPRSATPPRRAIRPA